MKITKPGIYKNVPMDSYHSDLCDGPSISSSGLRTIFTQSPAHYFDNSYLNPDREEDEIKEHFTLGRAAHHLLLGEDDFSTQFIVRPDSLGDEAWHSNKTICKAWLREQAKVGRTVLLKSQLKQIKGMAKALAGHPLVQCGILNGDIEQSLVWKDKETGIWLKARPDAIPNDSGDFADLKGTSNYGFQLDRNISDYRYDMQAALTKWGAREVLGLEMKSFSLVFVSFKRPHCVDVISLSPDDIGQAELDLRTSINTFAHCLKSGNWFGPAGTQSDARWVHISDWARKQAEFRRDFLGREIAAQQSAQDISAEYLAAG